MRTIRQLLKIMLDNQQYFETGLCRWANELRICRLINFEEQKNIEHYIDKFPTEQYTTLGSIYYWEPCLIEPRIEWLKKHIELLKQQE